MGITLSFRVDVGQVRSCLWSTQDSPWFKEEAEIWVEIQGGEGGQPSPGLPSRESLQGSPEFLQVQSVGLFDGCVFHTLLWLSSYWQTRQRNLFCVPEYLDKMFSLAHRGLVSQGGTIRLLSLLLPGPRERCPWLAFELPKGQNHRLPASVGSQRGRLASWSSGHQGSGWKMQMFQFWTSGMVSGILLLKPAPQVIRMQVSIYHSLRDKYSGHGKSLVPGRPGPKFHHISDVTSASVFLHCFGLHFYYL